MDTSNTRSVRLTTNRLRAELRRLNWAAALSDEAFSAIMSRAETVEFSAGEMVVEVGSEINHVYFLATGSMQATLYDSVGKEIQHDTFVRGSVIGLFAVGLSEHSHMQVVAVEPSTTIRLTLPDLLNLTAKHPDFQIAMFRLSARRFKQYVMDVDRSLPKPAVVGIIHHSEASRPLLRRLALRLLELDESPCVAGDDVRWRPDGDIPFMLLVGNDEQQSIPKEWAFHKRLFVDVRADHSIEELGRFLNYVEIALWCVRPQDANAAVQVLRELEKSLPKWRNKVRIVWVLDANTPFCPFVPELNELAQGEFRISFDPRGPNQSSLLQQGFERIIHHLRGIQIGLALGGGAARGMAHLGVMKVLEENGIYIDMLAGTSAGALTGTLYGAGLDPDYIARRFKEDLRPSWFFRKLPAGGYWYLLYKYRRNRFDPMLRQYLGNAKMEQLIIPVSAISVDLVEGEPLVREHGDATINVLESINLPPLSLPIIHSGQALVDGGLLNNIPANVLVAKGCNFVIASSVTAKLEKDFIEIRSKGLPQRSRFFSTIQVIMRQSMIQGHKMNSVGVAPADFVIAPDVTSFDISEFTRADEMATIGAATTDANVGKLLKMLRNLDSKLFDHPPRPIVAEIAPPSKRGSQSIAS